MAKDVIQFYYCIYEAIYSVKWQNCLIIIKAPDWSGDGGMHCAAVVVGGETQKIIYQWTFRSQLAAERKSHSF